MSPRRQSQLSYSVSKPYRIVAREFEDALTGEVDEIDLKLDNTFNVSGDEELDEYEQDIVNDESKSIPRMPISRGVLLLIRLNLLKKDGELRKIIGDSTSIPSITPSGSELMRDQKSSTYLRNITVAKEFEMDIELFKLECIKCGVSVSLAISRLIDDIMKTNLNEHNLIDILSKVHGFYLNYKINVSLGEKI